VVYLSHSLLYAGRSSQLYRGHVDSNIVIANVDMISVRFY